MFVYLVVAAIAWGTGGAVASLLYQESGLGPAAVSWWRFIIGAALLAAFVRYRTPRTFDGAPSPRAVDGALRSRLLDGALRSRLLDGALRSRLLDGAPRSRNLPGNPRVRRGSRGGLPGKSRMVVLGLGMAVSQTAYFAAVGRSGVAVATVITLGVSPLLVAIGERLLLAERITRWQGAALALAIGGLCLLILTNGPIGGTVIGAVDGTAEGGNGNGSTAGVALALLSGVTYAGVILLQRANGSGSDPVRGAMASFGVGALLLLPLALLEGIVPDGDIIPTVVMLVYLGAVPTALAYALFFAALGRVKATTASVVALLEPVTAAMIGVALLHEQLTLPAAIGALVLLLAVAGYPLARDLTLTQDMTHR